MKQPRILFVSPNVPYPANSGGAQRSALFLETLSKIGIVDCVFYPAEKLSNEVFKHLRDKIPGKIIIEQSQKIQSDHLRTLIGGNLVQYLGEDMISFYQARRERWQPYQPLIDKVGPLEKYDLVVARYLSSACIMDLFRHKSLILDIDDYDPERISLRLINADFRKKLTLRRVLQHSLRTHNNYLPKIPFALVSNPNDRKHDGLADATRLPNIPYSSETKPQDQILPLNLNSQTFLMVGTFHYSANIEGAANFIHQAWPSIQKKFPMSKLMLVGKGIPKQLQLKWLKQPGIEIHGYVQELKAAYENCLATIAPIQSGGGTNIKVLESSLFGRTSILTRTAHRGFENTLPDGQACLVAPTVREMAQKCILLLKDPKAAEVLGTSASRLVNEHHSRQQFETILKNLCQETLRKSKAPKIHKILE